MIEIKLNFEDFEVDFLSSVSFQTLPAESWMFLFGSTWNFSDKDTAFFTEKDSYLEAKVLASAFVEMGYKTSIWTCENRQRYVVYRCERKEG